MDERIKWFRRLKRCLKEMPPDCEVMVHNGSVSLVTPESRETAFKSMGHVDDVPELDWFSSSRIYPCDSSL